MDGRNRFAHKALADPNKYQQSVNTQKRQAKMDKRGYYYQETKDKNSWRRRRVRD